MKAAFMKSPNKFIVKDVDMRQLKESEVLVKVGACGLCGYDLILSAGGTEDWQPFGHEVSGLVVEKGRLADNVQIGEKVVLQSGTFDRYSEHVLNGRADLDTKGKVLWPDDGRTMGFAEYMIVPMELCVPFDELTFEEACLTEPLGVALDLVQTADIRLNDNVLVWGLGPIGLMALKLACSMGAAVICGASRSYAVARNDLAMKFGAKDVIFTDTVPIEEYGFPAGGIDKILLTAPPSEIPSSIKLCNRGGIIAYLGIEYGANAKVTFDANEFHFKKLQLRSSFASPCLNFPMSLDLIRNGVVPVKDLITNRFVIDDLPDEIDRFMNDKVTAIKAVMISGE